MKYTNIKKLFYNFKQKKLICKDLDFNINDKHVLISFEEKPSRKEDCYFLGEMTLEDCGKFAYYIREKERIGVRDEPLPELTMLLKYFKEWQKQFQIRKSNHLYYDQRICR